MIIKLNENNITLKSNYNGPQLVSSESNFDFYPLSMIILDNKISKSTSKITLNLSQNILTLK